MCWQLSRRVTRTCPVCGSEFTTHASNVRRGQMTVCSKKCRGLQQRKHPVLEYKGEIYYLCGEVYRCYSRHHAPRYLHHVIWEEHFGPVPRGYRVLHKDGNKLNNSIDNLALKSQSELATRPKRQCAQPDCDRTARTRGLCSRHYQQGRAKERGGWKVAGGQG
jgi:hypothetical protein